MKISIRFYLNKNNFIIMNKLLFLMYVRNYYYKKKHIFVLNDIFKISNIVDRNLFDFVKLYALYVKFEMKILKIKNEKKNFKKFSQIVDSYSNF